MYESFLDRRDGMNLGPEMGKKGVVPQGQREGWWCAY